MGRSGGRVGRSDAGDIRGSISSSDVGKSVSREPFGDLSCFLVKSLLFRVHCVCERGMFNIIKTFSQIGF